MAKTKNKLMIDHMFGRNLKKRECNYYRIKIFGY